jgi:hypothetical protein
LTGVARLPTAQRIKDRAVEEDAAPVNANNPRRTTAQVRVIAK